MAKNFSANDAKNLICRHAEITKTLNDAVASEKALRGNVKAAADQFVAQETIRTLHDIPVDELKRYKNGIRTKALADRYYRTLADLYGASVRDLTTVKGIGQENAAAIKKIVNNIAEKTRKEIRIRLNSDEKSRESSKLVHELCVYKNSVPYIRRAEDILREYGEQVDKNVNSLKSATNALKWMFTSKANKERAETAYNELSALLSEGYFQSVQEVAAGIQRAGYTSERKSWEDFSRDSIPYNNYLEGICPERLGKSDSVYGLPEELALEVQAESLFPNGLKCTLRRYQEWGVKYTLHQGRVLLGDEMGLGKTVQAIAAMVSLTNTGATHFVVVCPASVVTNWCREIEKHSTLKVHKVHGGDKLLSLQHWKGEGGVAVTTYETASVFESEGLSRFSMLVVDEAHYVKNPQAKRSVSVKNLCDRAERVLFMTGTALENRVDEMITLISMLQPKIAGQLSRVAFLASAPEFREKIAPVYYRRKREDVLTELPELIESREWCRMTREEESVYEEAVLNKRFADARRVSWNAENVENSSKANRLREIVEEAEAEDRKVIVFSFFLDTVRKVTQYLEGRCMPPITGAVTPQRRQEIIDSFDTAPAGSVLVAQIQSGGTGLNVQSASVVVLCEPQFKPSIENQAISRAYRMGQSRNVLVYRLLCEDSVDERITELLEQKQALFDAFADESVSAQESREIDERSFGDIIAEEIARINERRSAAQYGEN